MGVAAKFSRGGERICVCWRITTGTERERERERKKEREREREKERERGEIWGEKIIANDEIAGK